MGLPEFVTLLGNSFLYQLRGMVLAWDPGVYLHERDLVLCFVISCSIMKNGVSLPAAVLMIRLPSLGINVVKLSK